MERIAGFLIVFFYFALPAAAVIWFVVSLVGFLKHRTRREEDPDGFVAWRRSLIASAIAATVLVGLCVGIYLMLVAAVAHM